MPDVFSAYHIRQLENRLIEHGAQHHYELIDIPIIDSADLFLTRAGDKIIDSLFTFERHNQTLALRPEFTATAARRYFEQQHKGMARWQFVGAIFADDASAAEQVQRRSFGAELIGVAGSAAEAEIIQLAARAIELTDLHDWHVVTGHVALQSHLLARFALDSRTTRLILAQREALRNPAQGMAYALEQLRSVAAADQPELSAAANPAATQQMLDVLLDSTQYGTTMGGRTREDIVRRLLHKRQRAAAQADIQEALRLLERWVNISTDLDTALPQIEALIGTEDLIGQQLLADWLATVETLQTAGLPRQRLLMQPNLARNWEYYTGIVFGIRAPTGVYVVGGGRYDDLIRLLGGAPTPAVGFAVYTDRLIHEITQQSG